MVWSEVQITTTNEAEDAVAEAFHEAGAGGVVIESSNDVEGVWGDPLVGYIDESLLKRPENTSLVRGYFPIEEETDKKIQDILLKVAKLPEYGLDPGSGELKIVEIEDQDWSDNWKKYFLTTHVTEDIVVVPSWEDYTPEKEENIISMDPGMAFGTGTHETTKLCADLLERYIKPGYTIIDVGCGTGILSIIASQLGAESVIGIDIDPIAVRVARENIEKNNIKNITVLEGDLLTDLSGYSADIVIANILPGPIISLLPQLHEHLKPNGVLIASGIINEYLSQVVEALEENSFTLEECLRENDWCGLSALKL